MAKVKCEYCGNYIEDTLENCDVCGAVNEHHHRVANDTPKTIEELKSWYAARNLPSEETTRFFIGKNIKEPRAFGIYQDGNKFIVYKNKANGQRAVRYKGTDEAYAVNELYMRLKEEILNQKNINLKKKEQKQSSRNYIGYVNTKYTSRKKKKSPLKLIWSVVFIPVISMIFMFGIMGSLFYGLSNTRDSGYYLSETNDIYYLEEYKGVDYYVWWTFDEDTKEWTKFATYEDEQYPDGITEDDYNTNLWELSELLNVKTEELDIYNSRTFIDAGNHRAPSEGYYKHGDDVYYYLNDLYGNDYGTRDNTGWYKYVDNNWEYYCDYDDKEKLGEDLWYDDNDYCLGSSYYTLTDNYDFENYKWSFTNFETTEWYEEAEAAEKSYDKYQEERENDYDNDSWDDDSDYDWDSGDSWDSGSTDWDSDW